ncbi:hypothetical protein Y1Q_0018178 [Alligator mississippiensis]|uniref:C-type lectin domain-containing protein n=2 Tax=Alligator mississippiensis TaxID=8496 RepID=A0A151MRQ2_ALLMI|nr:hypothetical protein Y1Q_0018178 [Alligator mississippiensis]
MQDEEGYTTLNFQASWNAASAHEQPGSQKVRSTLSSTWRVATVTLFTLCLLLVVGLTALAVLFFQVTKDCQEKAEKLKPKEEVLQTDFTKKLQEIRESLCLDGGKENKNNGVNCRLCPANWQLKSDKSCYYVSEQKDTWEESQTLCSVWNSSLVLVKDKAKLGFLRRQFPNNTYWIGFSFKRDRNGWIWEDNTPLTPAQKNMFALYKEYPCACISSLLAHSTDCNKKNNWICEKAAFQLS